MVLTLPYMHPITDLPVSGSTSELTEKRSFAPPTPTSTAVPPRRATLMHCSMVFGLPMTSNA